MLLNHAKIESDSILINALRHYRAWYGTRVTGLWVAMEVKW